jgi:DNA-binding NtrC family response regulator
MNNCDNKRVIVVDDEPSAVKVLSAILSEEGYEVFEAEDGDRAIDIVKEREVDAVITDLKMPGKDGMHVFEYIKENHPGIPVIFLTAYGTVESAVYAMTRGAYYYFIKPPDYLKLKGILARAVEQRHLKRELEVLKGRLSEGERQRIIGNLPGMLRIYETIDAVKDSGSSVLISGETGTGKELIARALHYSSARKDRPFVAVNCTAIPRELMESELFGHEKGAFTGAMSRRIGKFEAASGGTVFLDEIGDLEPSLQGKLLRALQEREIERLGSNQKIKVGFRLVCSTNRELEKEVEAGNFREDLYYRINVVGIKVPPLRARRDDIPLLVAEFVKEFSVAENKTVAVSSEVMGIFQRYHWPGNVRQLRNVVERAVILARSNEITPKELSGEFKHLSKGAGFTHSIKTLKDLQGEAIKEALEGCNGNKSKAAGMLGISRKAFYKRLKDMGMYPSGTA